jgi:hypothetical protein
MENACKIENSNGRNHFGDTGVDVRISLADMDLIGIWYL